MCHVSKFCNSCIFFNDCESVINLENNSGKTFNEIINDDNKLPFGLKVDYGKSYVYR